MTDSLARILEQAAIDDEPEPPAFVEVHAADVDVWGHEWACDPRTCLRAAWEAFIEGTAPWCPTCHDSHY